MSCALYPAPHRVDHDRWCQTALASGYDSGNVGADADLQCVLSGVRVSKTPLYKSTLARITLELERIMST